MVGMPVWNRLHCLLYFLSSLLDSRLQTEGLCAQARHRGVSREIADSGRGCGGSLTDMREKSGSGNHRED